MAHQNDTLSVPSIRWIGVYPSEIVSLNLPSISLTNMDQERIVSLLKRYYIKSNSKLLQQVLKFKQKELIKISKLYTLFNYYLICNYLIIS